MAISTTTTVTTTEYAWEEDAGTATAQREGDLLTQLAIHSTAGPALMLNFESVDLEFITFAKQVLTDLETELTPAP